MSIEYVVLDSSVFLKIFLQEEERDAVFKLLQYIGDNTLSVVCPDIFVYEVLSVAVKIDFH